MSGFEIAGVVLGVLPLVISGLEQYRDGLDGVQAALRYREVIADLIVTFRAITAGYQTICERALRQLMLTDEEYTELFDDPKGGKWKEIDTSMRQCLGVNYRSFLEVVARLHRDITKFAGKLDLDAGNGLTPKWLVDDNKGSFLKKLTSKSNRLFKSIHIGLESGRLESSLGKIESDLRLLERMIPESASTFPVKSTTNARTRSIWKDCRQSARRLFEAVSASWVCTNQHDHTASLRLEPHGNTSRMSGRPRFTVVLSVQTITSNCLRSKCYHVEIESAESDASNLAATSVPNTHLPSTSKVNQRRVKISEVTSYGPTITFTKTSSSSHIAFASAKRIQNICHCLQSTGNVNKCLGFLEKDSWNHQIFRTPNFGIDSSWLTLQDVLASGQNVQSSASPANLPKPLTLPEKYHVSYILASSVLQLADTPWLPSSWGLRDVHFNHSKSTTQREYPYIRNKFSSSTASQTINSSSTNRLISNETTFALGVVLIELFYGKPLGFLRKSEDLDTNGDPTSMTDQLTATRLLDEIRSQHGDNFADAVQRCIYGSFNSAGCDFENPTLQGQFYEGVIGPLKKISDAL